MYRSVDKNYDGLYEVTEYYNFDTFNHFNFINESERILLYEELFGTIDALEGLYISKITIDDNNDEIPECSEEFFFNGKKTTWFDENGEVVIDGETIVLGGNEKYKSMCWGCYQKAIDHKTEY